MWQIEKLPFVWSHRPTPSNAPLPDALPLWLDVDSNTDRFLQVVNPVVQDALSLAYRTGSVITGAMSEKGIGRKYADDFLSTVLQVVERSGHQRMRILDIGCGNGYLARELAALGHDVIGIDPGNQLVETKTADLQLIRDFFPSKRIQGKFDLILAYALVEHIEEPVAFLASLNEYLTPESALLIAVPDCSGPIALGDPSMFVHEHYSYFTAESLSATIGASGFHADSIRKAGFGGMLYASANLKAPREIQSSYQANIDSFQDYKARVESNLSKLDQLMSEMNQQGKQIGIVVPGRIINALTMLNKSSHSIRFFDDNTGLHGTYYPPFNIPVEPTENLIKRPTDVVLVMSQTFGQQIASRLMPQISASTQIITMKELFEEADVAAH
jgi:2-polyprenyl-3-methyl-5-hydroxy-6-metoxy-1,4-benzoquinol methylase